jgi:mannose-1-phosphate guanylyltransferase/mannose-6-phosphate isomerase
MSAPRPIQPVIMSGGAGTRLWPMSRAGRPKQFLPLASEKTLFQETLERIAPGRDAPFLPAIVIGAEVHADLMRRQAETLGLPLAAIILEPAPRNTGPVAAIAALASADKDKDALVLLLPADHHIADRDSFRRAVAAAAGSADEAIVTFGIKPDRPHTGYGYIERGAEVAPGVFAVAAFLEKPPRPVAEAYLKGGRHDWNAGIFLYAPEVMLGEIAAHQPKIGEDARRAFERARREGALLRLDRTAFEAAPSLSIDYAVMERTRKARVAGPIDVGWSDIGAWSAIAAKDSPSAFALDSRGATIVTEGPFVGVIGLDDIVVVATGDAVLVARKDRAEEVKAIVEELKARGRKDLL